MKIGDRPGPPEVRTARPAEWLVIGELLGDAFQDDPLWAWMAPDPRRRQLHLGSLFAQVVKPLVGAGHAHTNEDRSGAAVWAPPNGWKTSNREAIPLAVPFMRAAGLSHLKASLAAIDRMEQLHPDEPHWYLAVIGSDPQVRAGGFGHALMRSRLDRCDAEYAPAYLESSNPDNIGYYQRFCYEVTGEITLPDGGPVMYPMWRNPR